MTKYTKDQIKANRLKWVKALESGEYKQGQYALKKYDAPRSKSPLYCCLGVACEVAFREGAVKRHKVGQNGTYVPYGESKDDTTLPKEVSEWLGVNPTANTVYVHYNLGFGGQKVDVISLNDNYDFTFEKIAEIVRKEFKL